MIFGSTRKRTAAKTDKIQFFATHDTHKTTRKVQYQQMLHVSFITETFNNHTTGDCAGMELCDSRVRMYSTHSQCMNTSK